MKSDERIAKECLKDMLSQAKVVEQEDISELEDLLLVTPEVIRVLPYDMLKPYEGVPMRLFLHKYGIYVLPTWELINFLKTEIVGMAIEIGAGNGSIARGLGIKATDSYLQDTPEVKLYYLAHGQPVVKYPRDVERLNAEEAIKKYVPDTVIGAYITHKWNGKNGNYWGVIEGRILRAGIKYIMIGNDNVHSEKPILKHAHTTYRMDWLITRSPKELNFIKIWNE